MEELFDALLDISRLDAGAIRPQVVTFPLAALFDRAALRVCAGGAAERLVVRCCKTLPSMFAATRRCSRASFVIWLRTPFATRTTAAWSWAAAVMAIRFGIEVWDSGRGIAPENRAAVFKEFTQLDNPERDRHKGLGLGLAIVHRLARLLGHEVGLRSVPGAGSVFAITLPRGRQERLCRGGSGGRAHRGFRI